eukprot:gene46330-66742_t
MGALWAPPAAAPLTVVGIAQSPWSFTALRFLDGALPDRCPLSHPVDGWTMADEVNAPPDCTWARSRIDNVPRFVWGN